MKNHTIFCSKIGLAIFLTCIINTCFCQNYSPAKPYTYFSFFYVDNSDGFEADPLNFNMVQLLRDEMNKLNNRSDNFFFFYGCDGDESKTANNLNNFIGSSTMKKYLNNPSRESDYNFDKSSIRNALIDYPVTVKQQIEINIFLSTNAIKQIIAKNEELPTPLYLANELPMYLISDKTKQARLKLNIYINKEAATSVSEAKIRSYFTFCNQFLNNEEITPNISFL